MDNKFFTKTDQPSGNTGSSIARVLDDEFKSANKLKRTRKKLKKYKKLYRSARSSKKGSRKKYKKKLQKYEMRVRDLEHDLEILHIQIACERRFYQLLYYSSQTKQISKPQVLHESQPLLGLPDFTKGASK